jgi:hypothetical protein
MMPHELEQSDWNCDTIAQECGQAPNGLFATLSVVAHPCRTDAAASKLLRGRQKYDIYSGRKITETWETSQ